MRSNDVTWRGTLMGDMALTAALGRQVGRIGIAGASMPTWSSSILVAPALSLASGASTNSISCTGRETALLHEFALLRDRRATVSRGRLLRIRHHDVN